MVAVIPTVAAYQNMNDLDAKQRAYVEGRRDDARKLKLPVVLLLDPETGKKMALVASSTKADVWHEVRKIGMRYVCTCPAMRSPDTGEYNRYITCKHAQTVALIAAHEQLGPVMHLEAVARLIHP